MKIEEIVLHPKTTQHLYHLVGILPHALIIDGPVGSGVKQTALTIARSVGSPEFIIFPKKKIKQEFVVNMNEGSVIIEDIRRLYSQTRSMQPGKQVYVIDTGLKSITVGAQNALLKLLEEPRNNIHFIIATHRVDQLLPTITSRCQRLTLLDITDQQTNELIIQLGVTDGIKAKRLAFVGRGKPALIKRLVTDVALYDERVAIMTDAKAILSGGVYDRINVVQKYKDDRLGSLTLLSDVIYQLRVVLKTNPDKKLVKYIDNYLKTSERISAGGNIRLQLTSSVLG